MSKRGRQIATQAQVEEAFKALKETFRLQGLEMVYERKETATGETSKVTFLGDSKDCAQRGLPRAPLGLDGVSGGQFCVAVEIALRLLPFAAAVPVEPESERVEL